MRQGAVGGKPVYKMRNILLIHLESLNYMNYQMNKEFFPTLRKWERRALSFSKYFSTATSTMMVMSDLAYGGMLQNEPCDNMADGLRKYCYRESLLDGLKGKGYRVKVVGYPEDGTGDAVGCNQRHFIGYTVGIEEVESYGTCMRLLEDAVTDQGMFAVWACNYIGNSSYNNRMENTDMQTGLERWESGYRYIDRWVCDLMDLLERKDLLRRTTVLFYGDHGDDLFAHGRHAGLMHAVEPYEALIHTPFWIYDSRFAPETLEELVDTTDIRGLVEQLLGLPEQKLGRKDLKLPARTYSMARNVYAAQKVRELSFHKGYSLTDGKFLFVAGDRGMEFYHIGMDPSCQHNLLDYFDFEDGALLLNRAAYGKMKFHFRHLLDEAAMAQVEEIFYAYRMRLMTEVERLYEYAECPLLTLEIGFGHIHYGWEERERRQSPQASAQAEYDLYERYLEGKKIILYGAGRYGTYFYEKMAGRVEIVAWVDAGYEHMSCAPGKKIQTPDCIKDLKYDRIFIAVLDGRARQEIKKKLVGMGIAEEKIV